jgi:hypothetical protein
MPNKIMWYRNIVKWKPLTRLDPLETERSGIIFVSDGNQQYLLVG